MKIISSITSLKHQFNHRVYHLNHKKKAKNILNEIESIKGKTEPKLIELSNEYSKDVLGNICYAPWLYVYSAISGSFKEGWIPDNYYGRIVVPFIKGDYGKVSELKPLANKLFNSNLFPDIAYYVNGLWFSANCKIIGANDLKEVIFQKSSVVVFKLDNSLQGRGIFLFEKHSFDLEKIGLLGNGVFQEFINQHPFFEELMPTSVATIRITTVLKNDGNASVRACYLRIGRNVDTHVKSSSHIRVPINIDNRELNPMGYLTNWNTTEKHPDTDFIFAKKEIPCLNECFSSALQLHKSLPHVRCIGWDMIINQDNEVKVMEWNGFHNDIKFSEATQGPCFGDLGWEKLWQKTKVM
jgi:hypothetical protein